VTLDSGSRKALEAICDTFAPGGGGLPSATERGVPDAMLQAVGANPREEERLYFSRLLTAWDRAAAGTEERPFSSLAQADRERVLLAWADSEAPEQRAAFQALRKGVLLSYYAPRTRARGPTRSTRRSSTRARSARRRTRRRRRSSR
jgi:long-chain-alcohol oxidase